jgi:hypothetical protein
MDLASNDQFKAAQELLVRAGEILREEQERDKITACRFNVFNALGVERAELAHSRFLKCLLDPNGIHDQKDLFLQAFLRDVLSEEAERLDLKRSEVRREVPIDNGQLDIQIILPDKQIIIIENKVEAGEGEKQLERYRSWLQDQPHAKSGRPHRLVFLTPDGRSPSSCSPTEVKCVSYGKIADWLDRLKDKIPPRLEVVLSQYVNLWRAMPMNQELIKLLQDPKNRETAERISMAVEEMKDEAKRQFLVQVQEDLKRRLHQSNLSENWDVLHTPHTETYAGVGIFWRNRKLMEGQKEKLWQFAVHCEAQDSSWTKVYIGIYRGAEITQKDRLDERDTKVFGKLSEKYINLRPSKWWTGFLDLPDLLGGTLGLKSFINELLGEEHQIHQIAEQVAKALWEIFESYRIELEGLNQDYPVPYLDGFRTCSEPLTGAITWASQTGHE